MFSLLEMYLKSHYWKRILMCKCFRMMLSSKHVNTKHDSAHKTPDVPNLRHERPVITHPACGTYCQLIWRLACSKGLLVERLFFETYTFLNIAFHSRYFQMQVFKSLPYFYYLKPEKFHSPELRQSIRSLITFTTLFSIELLLHSGDVREKVWTIFVLQRVCSY